MNLVFLGPPGAGKGTQAARVADMRGLARLSTGDMLRMAVEAGTEIGKKAAAIMERGDLVPDDVVAGIVDERISEPDCTGGFILDGFPRTRGQAEILDTLLSGRGLSLDAVIHIEVADDLLLKRVEGRAAESGAGVRADDNAEALANRLKVYHAQTAPLVDYYRSRGLLRDVDGTESVEAVTRGIEAALEGGRPAQAGTRPGARTASGGS